MTEAQLTGFKDAYMSKESAWYNPLDWVPKSTAGNIPAKEMEDVPLEDCAGAKVSVVNGLKNVLKALSAKPGPPISAAIL